MACASRSRKRVKVDLDIEHIDSWVFLGVWEHTCICICAQVHCIVQQYSLYRRGGRDHATIGKVQVMGGPERSRVYSVGGTY